MFVWVSATTFAVVIVTIDSHVRSGVHAAGFFPNAPTRTLSRAAHATVLVAAAMNPVTFVGAPVYTSGTHWWNGTTAILKARPMTTRPSPIDSSADGCSAARATN